jgi:hypothetical protein
MKNQTKKSIWSSRLAEFKRGISIPSLIKQLFAENPNKESRKQRLIGDEQSKENEQ